MTDLHIAIDGDEPTERPAAKHNLTEARVPASALARAVVESNHLRRALVDTQRYALGSAIDAARAEGDAAERDYQAAFEAGDSAKLCEAQRRLHRSESRMVQFEGAKAHMETQPGNFSGATTNDPVEEIIAKASPRTQAWLNEHREYVSNPKLSMKASAAHNMALAEGYIPDSDAYFDFCENFLGLREGGSGRARAQNSTALEDGARVLKVNPNGPLPPGAVKLSRREFELATEVLTWETGPKRGTPLGVREYLRRRQLQQGDPGWQRLD